MSVKNAVGRTDTLQHFLTEVCHWEAAPGRPEIGRMDEDAEQVEVGRFQLTRRGRLVHLDVRIDGRQYKDLLRIWGKHAAWDWGEDRRKPAT